MILIDVIDAERRKIVAALTPAAPDADPGPSRRPAGIETPVPPSFEPPDYETSQKEIENLKAADIEKAANQKQRRLRRYLIYALVIYLVLSLSIGIPLFLTLRRGAGTNTIQDQEMWMSKGVPPPPPLSLNGLPADVLDVALISAPVSCNNWSFVPASDVNEPYYKLQYTLPLSNTLYIRSNFSEPDDEDDVDVPITGNLRVGVTNDTSRLNATMTIVMKDIGEDALRDADVCLMNNVSTSIWGLSILVPNAKIENKYDFDVDLELPLSQAGAPLCNFVTYLPSFNQSFDSLDSYVTIDNLDVEGSVGDIYFESVHATNILVKTSAASISGNFNATGSIYLETVLQPVTANVSLFNSGYSSNPTQLNVQTGSSNISMNVYLYSTSSGNDSCQPLYMTNLQTFSGSIDANFYHDASIVASSFYLRALNSLEPSRIFVDRVFQGLYDVRTSLADAILEESTDVVDPSGAGRSRIFDNTYNTSNRAYGWVGWGAIPSSLGSQLVQQQGQIEIVSSLSPAILQLTDAPDYSVLTSIEDSASNDGSKYSQSEYDPS